MTKTLLGVSPPSSKGPADPPSAEELAAAKGLVRQARVVQRHQQVAELRGPLTLQAYDARGLPLAASVVSLVQ